MNFHEKILKRLNHRKEYLAGMVVYSLLVCFIFFLLIWNYLAQRDLNILAEQKFRQETRSYAGLLGLYLDDCLFNLLNLTENSGFSPVPSDSENKPAASIDPVREITAGIHQFFDHGQASGRYAVDRLIFLNENDECLVDINSGIDLEGFSEWTDRSFSAESYMRVFGDDEGKMTGVAFIIPCYIERRKQGHLIAWITGKNIFDHITPLEIQEKQALAIVSQEGTLFYGKRVENFSPAGLKTMEFDKTERVNLKGPYGTSRLLAIMSPVGEYPFSIVNFMPAGFIENFLPTKQLFFIIGGMAVLMLITAGGVVRMNMETKILETRVEEASRSKKEIKHKNLELLNKIQKIEIIDNQLKQSEEKYKAIVQNLNEGYFETDRNGYLQFFNEMYCELMGRTADELKQANFRDLVDPNSTQKLKDAFARLYKGEDSPRLIELAFYKKDRFTLYEVSVSLIRDFDGEPAGFRGILRDVTERHLSILAVRESEERLKTILHFINAGIVIIDPQDHRIVEANAAALKMIGADRKEVVGSVCHCFICPAQIGECPITDLGQKVDNMERTLICKDGRRISILKSALEIYFNGRTHLLESFIDISTLKEIQNELEHAKNIAENANRTKSEFLANMSHELRTPLNHIIGFSELILDPHFGSLNETQEEYVRDIHESSRHLLSLINDILDLSKIEAGKMELEASAVAIRRVLENTLSLIKEKTIKHGLKISLEMNGIPEKISADERKLKQILYNLLSNSIKFTPDNGSIKISASLLPEDHSNPSLRPTVLISVEDTGIGIKPEDIERIFDYFQQVENSGTKQYEGTGIGLSLTRSMVELHGGRIWAESKGEGKGSVFRFTLPA